MTMAMEDLSSLFCYQESVEELKQSLRYMTYELQSAKMEMENELRKKKENMETMQQLLILLQTANKERDEAKDQIKKLLSPPPIFSPESPLFNKLLGSATESNSYSGDSLYDVVLSPGVGFNKPAEILENVIDPENELIYKIAKGRPLPNKGKLLEAVMKAGPLLKTLMVAGPLPRWRIPPPAQPLQVPPVGFSVAEIGPRSVKRNFSGAGVGIGGLMIPMTKRRRIDSQSIQ